MTKVNEMDYYREINYKPHLLNLTICINLSYNLHLSILYNVL